MKLIKVKIHHYKCFEDQSFNVDDAITILVGMNESGKTAILQALAKSAYFTQDNDFIYEMLYDYPRNSYKAIPREIFPAAIECSYQIEQEEINELKKLMGDCVRTDVFSITTDFNNVKHWNVNIVDKQKHLDILLRKSNLYSKAISEKLMHSRDQGDIDSLLEEYKDPKYVSFLKDIRKKYDIKLSGFDDSINEYVTRTWIEPKLPKFIYYDEYYSLPSRICIEDILSNNNSNVSELKTAKALIELARVNVSELKRPNDFEALTAELEATSAIISNELFRYWKNSKNKLRIEFKHEHEETHDQRGTSIIRHYLNIRVMNTNLGVTLPLHNRSKGFNWFFSFLVWFKKIQENRSTKYILLLDEPGLNLHASAQNDLLGFIEDLTPDYQVIYTTHSPFMIPTEKLHRVRTIVETDNGSIISESTKEKDPNTLFPLQAALGYDIAQNLFISQHNLIVEGISDLMYLNTMSGHLRELGRSYLNENITIVPVGGLDKVSSFVSLFRGNNLEIVCLLDSFKDQKARDRLDNLIREKIIQDKNILFFHLFTGKEPSDVEDLFELGEYIQLFENSCGKTVNIESLDRELSIVPQIKYMFGPYNHYAPANYLAKKGIESNDFSAQTIDRFERVFSRINSLFKLS